MRAAPAIDGRTGLWLVAGGVLVVVVAVASNGNLLAVAGALLAGPAVVALARCRLEVSSAVILAVTLLVDDVRARPYMALWTSPLAGAGRLIYDGIEKTVGVPGLKIYGIEILAFLLLVNLLARMVLDRGQMRSGPLFWAGALSLAMALWLEAWGLARGGNLRFSMLQLRPMALTGLFLITFVVAFRRVEAARRVLWVICAVAVVRALIGIYFWRAILPGSSVGDDLEAGGGAYIATHADTVLWVTAMWIGVTLILEAPSWRTIGLNVLMQPVLLAAIVGNNRRLASVSLAVSALVIYLVSDRRMQRRTRRILFAVGPLLVLYVGAAWTSTGMWARPVQALRSVIVSEDQSSDMRDIENYNLVSTARLHPILGSGLGHEYEEKVVAISIADLLEAYRYIPHNSLLWLAGAGGLVGVVGFWMFLPIGVFLAVLLYDRSRNPIDRVVAMSAVSAVVAYGTQCFADIGMQSFIAILVTAALLGAAGGRALAVGAWPTRRSA